MSTITTVVVRDVLRTTVVVNADTVTRIETIPVTQIVGSANAGPRGADGLAGADGAVGPQGPQGPPGDLPVSYRHVQSTPGAVWTVVHNLGYRPGGIYIEDSAHQQVNARVAHVDGNTLTLSFFAAGLPAAMAGEADIS